MLQIGVITLFPELFAPFTECGIVGRAIRDGRASVRTWNPRDYTHDAYRRVDDRPYGGGPGMVMMAPPLHKAIRSARRDLPEKTPLFYMSPQGKPLRQEAVQQLSEQPSFLILAGRYEGVDERLLEMEVDEEWSVGDYILSGGEPAAMVFIDAVIRLLPGALGHELSSAGDSFAAGLLAHPQYTRPPEFEGRCVPDVLTGGDHAAIKRWRREQALRRTQERRPDLLTAARTPDEAGNTSGGTSDGSSGKM